jgi:acyl-CoA synthetase (AMP-forming)/AMP-acid ligase II
LLLLLLAGLRLGFEVVLHNPKQPPLEGLVITDQTKLLINQVLLPSRRGGKVALLTSGSTGTPKQVRQKRFKPQLLAGLLERLGLGVGRRIALPLPLFHGHGLATLALGWLSGSELYVCRLEPLRLLDYLQAKKIDVLVLVPTILHRLLEIDSGNAPHLQAIICGSAPLAPELVRRSLARFGLVLFNLYGSTEAGLIALATPQDLVLEPQSVGKLLQPISLLEQQIVVDTILTGDLGRLERGLLFLLGRSDEMLICGGVNVYPQALEQQIGQLETIKDCAVLAIFDPEYGQAIVLYVVLYKPVLVTQLHQDLATMLPKAQRPKEIVVCQTLPRNELGKLQRYLLKSKHGKE